MSTYRERRIARAERLREWAEKRAHRADGNFQRAHNLVKDIPLGQPILVGHHSEKRHRRTLDRSDAAMRRGCEDQHKAESMSSRASNIEDAIEGAIYMDDPDAIERLEEKIAGLEDSRDRMKRANVIIRKKGPSDDEKVAMLIAQCRLNERTAREGLKPDPMGRLGFPSYAFSNLSGTITKERGRLALLVRKRDAGRAAEAELAAALTQPTADPLAIAGLTITEAMTTPAKSWKKPRPVWNVTGRLVAWGTLLERLGGRLYHGVYSFWEDPTDDIKDALVNLAPEVQS